MPSKPEYPEDRPISIFDTTLRDGEQSPGASMTIDEKLKIAHALKELGVDVIEAGFPIASPDDFRAVQEIARSIRETTICALARCRPEDIDRAWEAVQYAEDPRIHVFLGTSSIHRNAREMTPDRIIRMVRASVARAKQYCDNIEFSPEDAFRTEHPFLREVVEAAIEEGATTINIPDTVGYALPSQIQKTLTFLREEVPNIDEAVISVHCHDDLGLAVANSLAAVEAGAGQVECTINGIGERAGNCSLEEVVMAMQIRRDLLHARTRINTALIVPTSQLVQETTFPVQRNKAIVGQNAFAHEAGIHQDAFLKDPAAYEIMSPGDVGWSDESLPLGKHSGVNAIFAHLDKFNLPHDRRHASQFRERYKHFADAKVADKEQDDNVTDDELIEYVYLPVVKEIMDRENGGPMITGWQRIANIDGCVAVRIITRKGNYKAKASSSDEGVIDALVQGFKNDIYPGTDIADKGFEIDTEDSGSEMAAKVHVRLTNKNTGHTVIHTQRGKKTEEVAPAAVVAAFNLLYYVKEYQKSAEAEASNEFTSPPTE